MANRVSPKISAPGSSKFPTKGPHNPNVGTHGGGGALAKPGRTVPNGQTLNLMPVQHPTAGLANQRVGQPDPQTGAAATQKPSKRKTPAPFYGEF